MFYHHESAFLYDVWRGWSAGCSIRTELVSISTIGVTGIGREDGFGA